MVIALKVKKSILIVLATSLALNIGLITASVTPALLNRIEWHQKRKPILGYIENCGLKKDQKAQITLVLQEMYSTYKSFSIRIHANREALKEIPTRERSKRRDLMAELLRERAKIIEGMSFKMMDFLDEIDDIVGQEKGNELFRLMTRNFKGFDARFPAK